MPLWKLTKPLHIGKVIKSHGFKGAFRASFDVTVTQSLVSVRSVLYLSREVPYFVPHIIDEINFTSDDFAIIKLQLINTEDEAKDIYGYSIYLDNVNDNGEEDVESDDFTELIGFKVIEEELGDIGKVTDITHNTAYPLFVLDNKGKEIFIPILEEFIIDIDLEFEIITVTLPNGWLDLN